MMSSKVLECLGFVKVSWTDLDLTKMRPSYFECPRILYLTIFHSTRFFTMVSSYSKLSIIIMEIQGKIFWKRRIQFEENPLCMLCYMGRLHLNTHPKNISLLFLSVMYVEAWFVKKLHIIDIIFVQK